MEPAMFELLQRYRQLSAKMIEDANSYEARAGADGTADVLRQAGEALLAVVERNDPSALSVLG